MWARSAIMSWYTPAAAPHDPSTEPPARSDGLGPGDTVDCFRLERELGVGGFGVVYLARQELPVSRRVALKVLKRGMDSEAVLARFEIERCLLALMEHPNVARILDAGSTPSGRPYFVMEYFNGEPITTFAEREELSVRERLELFLQACDAVQHAHNRGVIHRDLKSSNVLVGRVDGRATAKVIDFGIAKAIEGELLSATTTHGEVLGTPAYMSPEQAVGSADIDIRSDVYMLGAMLYELLAQCPPFSLEQPIGELLREIKEVEPPAPSDRIARPADRDHRIPPDLDCIVLRCLQKERDDRYPTAQALAADVQRFLEGRPVDAMPAGALYRIAKLAGRHRVACVSAGLAVLSLLTAVAGLSAGLLAASEAHERMVHAYADARSEAERARVAEAEAKIHGQAAEDVVQFLVDDVLQNLEPSSEPAHGRDVSLREVLDEAASKLRGENAHERPFEHSPEARARINAAIGISYERLGHFALAVEHLEAAFEHFETERGLDHPRTLGLGSQLANLYTMLGRPSDADALFERISALPDALLAAGDAHGFSTLRRLAMLRYEQGRHDESLELIEKTLAATGAWAGPDSEEYLMIATSAAIIRDKLGDSDGAGELFAHIYETHLRREGPLGPSTLIDGVNYGSFLYQRGRLDEAHTLLERTLTGNRELYGAHPNTVGAMSNLALTKIELGEFDAALDLLYEARDITVELLDPTHPKAFQAEGRIAEALWDSGRREEALALMEDVLSRTELALGATSPAALDRRTDWVIHRVAVSADDELEAELLSLLEAKRQVFGELHPSSLLTRMQLAGYYDLREDERADAAYRDALDHYESALGPRAPKTLEMTSDYAVFLSRGGHHDRAIELARLVVDRGRESFGERSVIQDFHELKLGEILAAAGDDGAAEILNAVYERSRDGRGGQSGLALRAARALVRTHTSSGDFTEAESWQTRANQLASR